MRGSRFFMFQAFVIGVVLVIVLGLTRGIIYEEELARAQYPPGISVIGVARQGMYGPLGPLPHEYIEAVTAAEGLITEYWDGEWNEGRDYLGTSYRYLEVFQPALRAGRYFTQKEQEQPVCLVSEGLAKELYGTIAASLGRTISSVSLGIDLTIVGVLEDGVELPVKTVDQNGSEQYQFRVASDRFVIHPLNACPLGDWEESTADLAGGMCWTLLSWPHTWKSLTCRLRTQSTLPARHIGDQRERNILIIVLAGFAGLATVVAALGMFGMQMIQVLRRRQEIGLRMAVGARPHQILLEILGNTMFTILIPSGVGVAVGYALHPLLRRLAFPMIFDWFLVVLTFGVLVAFTLLVGFFPAWKGASLDPIECLGRTPRLN